MNKRAKENVMLSTILFLVLNAMFLALLLYGVTSRIDSSKVVEQSYAKQIGLLMNAASAGTNIRLDITPLVLTAEENNAPLAIVVDCERNLVLVRASRSGTYAYEFFNNLPSCESSFDVQARTLDIEVQNG